MGHSVYEIALLSMWHWVSWKASFMHSNSWNRWKLARFDVFVLDTRFGSFFTGAAITRHIMFYLVRRRDSNRKSNFFFNGISLRTIIDPPRKCIKILFRYKQTTKFSFREKLSSKNSFSASRSNLVFNIDADTNNMNNMSEKKCVIFLFCTKHRHKKSNYYWILTK